MKKQSVLITGINGFAGSHLVDYILQNISNVEIHGTVQRRSNLENIEHNLERIQLHECNMLDTNNVTDVIKDIMPHKVFHLAAQSHVATSWLSPNDTLNNNISSQCNLLEAIRKYVPECLIHVAGSSEEYVTVFPDELPINEDNPLRPLSPYAVSKVCTDLMGYQYFKSYNLQIVRTRAFNHSGPRRPDAFVDSGFAKQIVQAEFGLREPVVRHGNLEAIRDFTHAKDIVRAYWIALDKCEAGDVYNICSEVGTKIQDVLDTLISMSKVPIKTEIDVSKMRPSDVPILVGSCFMFKQATGWKAELSQQQILEDTMNYWRDKLKGRVL